jgi:hypothetical protein
VAFVYNHHAQTPCHGQSLKQANHEVASLLVRSDHHVAVSYPINTFFGSEH